jgi:hypothetical protein
VPTADWGGWRVGQYSVVRGMTTRPGLGRVLRRAQEWLAIGEVVRDDGESPRRINHLQPHAGGRADLVRSVRAPFATFLSGGKPIRMWLIVGVICPYLSTPGKSERKRRNNIHHLPLDGVCEGIHKLGLESEIFRNRRQIVRMHSDNS